MTQDNQIIYYDEDAPEKTYKPLPAMAIKPGVCVVEHGEDGWMLGRFKHKDQAKHYRKPIAIYYQVLNFTMTRD